MKKKITRVLVFLLLITAIFTRFWQVPQHFIFEIDEEYQALLSWSIVKHFHLLWIGVSASNIGFYLGPGLSYLGAFLLSLNKGNPEVFGYFASLLGIVTFVSILYIGSKLFNPKVALSAGIFYTFSNLIIYYDRKYWPVAIPLVSLWLFYSLVKARQNSRWLIVTGLLIGLSYHLHLTLFLFWPFIIFTYAKVVRKINLGTWLGSIGGYLTMISPLIFFDFVHNFDNLLLPWKIFRSLGSSTKIPINIHLDTLLTTNLRTWFGWITIDNISVKIILLLITLTLLNYSFFTKKNYPAKLISLLGNLFILSFLFYPGWIQEYYFVFFFTWLAFSFGLVIADMKPILMAILLSIFVAINFFSFLFFLPRSDFLARRKLIEDTGHGLISKEFYLSTDDNYLYNGGWRYLFQAYGLRPAQSDADSLFGWIYKEEISKRKPEYKLVITKNNRYKSAEKPINVYSSGVYYGYLFDN